MNTLTLMTERLAISLPHSDQTPAMLAFVVRNRQHLKPWNPPEPDGLYTLTHWQDVVANCAAAFDAGSAVRFWMSARDQPGHIIGSIGYSQIARGPFCSCVLGYQIDRECEGRGLMIEALRATNHYMFEQQKLHRIAANYRPENVRSGRLLAKLGFRIEGFARDYLFIDGAWRDHVLTSIANDAFNAGWLKTTTKR
ncbi:MAG: GNAT family N-acetyltransferase [Burkholderiales bacterium]|nr:GNAT family N-acetyltransferase [Burkholderiales bacterium]